MRCTAIAGAKIVWYCRAAFVIAGVSITLETLCITNQAQFTTIPKLWRERSVSYLLWLTEGWDCYLQKNKPLMLHGYSTSGRNSSRNLAITKRSRVLTVPRGNASLAAMSP